MLITGVGSYELMEAIRRADPTGNLTFNRMDAAGRTRRGSHKWLVTLRVLNSHGAFARRGFHGRRMVSACYHGHYAFMRELFALEPEATVSSTMATFVGQVDFERNAPRVGYRDVGSVYQPAPYDSLCDC